MFSLRTKLAIAKAVITKKGPYYVQYYINGVCNLKCKQCNIVETNSGIGELSLTQVEVFADNLCKIGGGIVLLTGGEPFLRKDIDQVAKRFIDRGLDVRLQTAGIARDEQLQKCYDVGVRDLNISLDSLDPNKQDYINSVPGSWAKAIDAIERVSAIFRGHSSICSLGCVLSRFNYKEIPAILEFATRIGWYVSLVPVHIARKNDFYGFRSYDEEFEFRSSDHDTLKQTIERLIEMKRQGFLLFDAERFLWSSYQFLTAGVPTWRHKGVCDSPSLYFAIRPNGDFTTCCDYVLDRPPSLAHPGFYRAYKSGKIHQLSDSIVKNCSGCHYGSYPEVTLSVRDKRALWERIKIVLLQEKTIIKKFERGTLPAIIEEIRAKYPQVYAAQAQDDGLARKLELWRDPEKRKELMREDIERRKREGRLRQPFLREPREPAVSPAGNPALV